MPAKKPAQPEQAATPRPAPPDAPTDAPAPSAPPSAHDRGYEHGRMLAAIVDPGPPPRMPPPPFAAGAVGERLAQEGETRDRASVQDVDVLRAGPAAANYKAELLHWLDTLAAHDNLRSAT